MAVFELTKFIGLVFAHDVLEKCNFSVKDCGVSHGDIYPIFSQTMSRNRFSEMMRYLCFDLR